MEWTRDLRQPVNPFRRAKGETGAMRKSRRKFGKEFKLTVLCRIAAGESVNEVARALEMDPSDVRRWRRELSTHGERAL